MPFDHNGQLVEAVDCASCNSSLEWHGRLPEDTSDVVCNDCHAERLTARAEKAEADVERLRVQEADITCIMQDVDWASPDSMYAALDAIGDLVGVCTLKDGKGEP